MQAERLPWLFVEIMFPDSEHRRCEMNTAPMPHVVAALFCEKVLQEKDGSLTVVRIADRLTYTLPPELPEGVKPLAQLAGLIALRSGSASGKFTLKIRSNSPSGKQDEDFFSSPIELRGGDHGQNMILNISMGILEDGLFWFDVILDDRVLTRIPLMVVRGEPAQSERK
jgi:uncharacterized protein DUF6941